jgi:hypothetical protein
MSNKPFEIMRWESPDSPEQAFLSRMMEREGLQATPIELAAQTHTPEMKFEQTRVSVVVAGKVQYSFPGYGVIELGPGDILEINPGVLHDIIVSGPQPAMLLEASRNS